MDGKKTRFVMPSLTRADLINPLLRIVQEKYSQIDLLVGVVDKNEAGKFSEVGAPLVGNLGYNSKDICCVFSHQLGPNRWKVLTTHGNAHVLVMGEDFEINICQNHEFPRETPILRQLAGMRNKLLSQSRGLPSQHFGLAEKIDIPYPKIRGNVLLCGDFSLWEPTSLLGLRKIFIANGAENVIFVTPAIKRHLCQKLERKGCNIVRLHPPEGRAEWLTTGQANA